MKVFQEILKAIGFQYENLYSVDSKQVTDFINSNYVSLNDARRDEKLKELFEPEIREDFKAQISLLKEQAYSADRKYEQAVSDAARLKSEYHNRIRIAQEVLLLPMRAGLSDIAKLGMLELVMEENPNPTRNDILKIGLENNFFSTDDAEKIKRRLKESNE